MHTITDFINSLSQHNFLLILATFFLLLIIIYLLKHAVFGVGRSISTLKRMNNRMSRMHPGEYENVQMLEDIRKNRSLSILWKSLYSSRVAHKDVQVKSIINYRSVCALGRFSLPFIIPTIVLLAGISAVIYADMFYNAYGVVNAAVITAISLLIIAVILFLLKTSVRGECVKFIAFSEAALPSAVALNENSNQLQNIDDTLFRLANVIEGLNAKNQPQRNGGKDIEAQVIESIITACLRKMDDNAGSRFERLNSAIDSSTKAQLMLLNSIQGMYIGNVANRNEENDVPYEENNTENTNEPL